jgi:predicted transcriptional regulator
MEQRIARIEGTVEQMDKRLNHFIEELAQRDKRTKTDILREAINRYIEDRRWKELREYGARQAAKLGIKEKDVERVREEYWEERRREISGRQ